MTLAPAGQEASGTPFPALRITPEALQRWLSAAFPGERIEYHRGFLCIDRCPEVSRLDRISRSALNSIADLLMTLAERGHVHLLQIRAGDGAFRYLAIFRSRQARSRRWS